MESTNRETRIVMAVIVLAMAAGLIFAIWHTDRRTDQYRADRAPAKQVYAKALDWRAEHAGSYAGFSHRDARVSSDGQRVEIRYIARGKTQCLGSGTAGAFANERCTLFGAS